MNIKMCKTSGTHNEVLQFLFSDTFDCPVLSEYFIFIYSLKHQNNRFSVILFPNYVFGGYPDCCSYNFFKSSILGKAKCEDSRPSCHFYVQSCHKNSHRWEWLKKNCKKTCKLCRNTKVINHICTNWQIFESERQNCRPKNIFLQLNISYEQTVCNIWSSFSQKSNIKFTKLLCFELKFQFPFL